MMQPHTILIADGDPVWAESMARLLEMEGYRVLLARTGADAFYQVYVRRPDLLLLSPHLSQWNGWEVCRRVKQERGLERVKVVMLSPSRQKFDDEFPPSGLSAEQAFFTKSSRANTYR